LVEKIPWMIEFEKQEMGKDIKLYLRGSEMDGIGTTSRTIAGS